ncbi:MAG: carbohydrate-binding family 9-like protein [Cyclobacteriaceae bacterium]
MDLEEWGAVPWTTHFVDIKGISASGKESCTRVKMQWDSAFLYIAAEIEEKHIWATKLEKDMALYHENVFEVFIDTDGSTHHYYELQINALGTVWDLMLTKPYRDGGVPISNWDIEGLKKCIGINGTLNDPSDTDTSWIVELAIPFKALAKDSKQPEGQIWRINFSHVTWELANIDGKYEKKINPTTGIILPEQYWVWSSQGVINMHQPEKWGYVFFDIDKSNIPNDWNLDIEEVKWELRKVYYAEGEYFEKKGTFTDQRELLDLEVHENILIATTQSLFEATMPHNQVTWHIDNEGKTWKTENSLQK